MIETFESTIIDKKILTPTVISVRFSLPKNFTFEPGQYISVTRISDGKKLRTPYSIASSPESGFGEFCIKVVETGKTSSYINSLKKGDNVELIGPFGRFTFDKSSKNKDLFFICNGTGISTFISMIPHLLKSGFNKKIILIKGFRDQEEILYDKEFAELSKKYPNFEFHNILSQPKSKFENKGHVQDFMEKFIPKDFKGHFYLCGLSEMIDSTKEKIVSLGFQEKNIFYEKYD